MVAPSAALVITAIVRVCGLLLGGVILGGGLGYFVRWQNSTRKVAPRGAETGGLYGLLGLPAATPVPPSRGCGGRDATDQANTNQQIRRPDRHSFSARSSNTAAPDIGPWSWVPPGRIAFTPDITAEQALSVMRQGMVPPAKGRAALFE